MNVASRPANPGGGSKVVDVVNLGATGDSVLISFSGARGVGTAYAFVSLAGLASTGRGVGGAASSSGQNFGGCVGPPLTAHPHARTAKPRRAFAALGVRGRV